MNTIEFKNETKAALVDNYLVITEMNGYITMAERTEPHIIWNLPFNNF